MTDSYIDTEYQKLVLAGLRVLPDDTSLSIGLKGNFKKSELVGHVEKNDEIGKQMIEIDKLYLRTLRFSGATQ
ncbi:MAG TPA: hypothetical protein VK674_01745 [Candidatus Limnocylindria bacterium]|nr:hypothetical protein [Candidatus Limnocylindria bacterium]